MLYELIELKQDRITTVKKTQYTRKELDLALKKISRKRIYLDLALNNSRNQANIIPEGSIYYKSVYIPDLPKSKQKAQITCTNLQPAKASQRNSNKPSETE